MKSAACCRVLCLEGGTTSETVVSSANFHMWNPSGRRRLFVIARNSHRLIVAPRKFDVLKTNICQKSEASRANMLVLRTSNFQGATIRPIVPRHKHSIVFIAHH